MLKLNGKLTGFLVESGTEGFTLGAEEKKLGMKGSSTVSLNFQNAKIPAENILGEYSEETSWIGTYRYRSSFAWK